MFPRSLFAVCALVLLATVTIRAEEKSTVEQNVDVAVNEEEVEARNQLLDIAVSGLTQAFKWAATNCREEAANHCKGDLKNPRALIKCAGSFLKLNKGRCVIG